MPTNPTQKIAAIGPRELISILESVGIDTYGATTTKTEVEMQIRSIQEKKGEYAILCITEGLIKTLEPALLTELRSTITPALLVIPDLASLPESGVDRIRELAKRATGSDILGGSA